MAHPKSMGIGAMFVLLVIAVIVLPMIVRYIDRMEPQYVAGFRNCPARQDEGNLYSDQEVEDIPAIGKASKLPTWRPDRNTDYLCRSPNESGQPCDEGQFCDGSVQQCTPVFVGGSGLQGLDGFYS